MYLLEENEKERPDVLTHVEKDNENDILKQTVNFEYLGFKMQTSFSIFLILFIILLLIFVIYVLYFKKKVI